MRLHMTMKMASVSGVAAALMGLLLIPSAQADVASAWYDDSSHFHYEISHMPDFDQKRNSLPNDFGCCDSTPGCKHCVPTSAANMVAYIANHGYPEIPPGAGFWYHEDYYNLSTTMIGFMGILMGTNSAADECATNGSGANAGLTNWMAPYPDFTVNDHLTDDDFFVTFEQIAESVISGNLGTMSYGRYDIIGIDPNLGVFVVDRGGGHATTVIRCFADGNNKFMWVCNPADDDRVDLDSEAPFNISVYTVTSLLVRVGFNGPYRFMTAINYPSDDGRIRFMDGHRTIRPLSGLTTSGGNTVAFIQPTSFTGHPSPIVDPIPTPDPDLNVLSLACQPETVDIYAVLGNSKTFATVYTLDRLTGEWSPGGELGLRLVVGRQRQVYIVALDDRIRCFPGGDLDADFIQTTAPFDADLIAFDDETDELVAVSKSDYKLMRFDKDLATAPQVTDLPTSIPLADIECLTINPTDRTLWFAGATQCLYWTDPNGLVPELLCHPEFNNVSCVDFDSGGRMYVVDDSAIEVYEAGGGFNDWDRNTESGFNGQPAGDRLCMMRNRSNVDPAIHDSPAWEHIPADELFPLGEVIPVCPGDFNGDGDVDAADLATLLGAWGPNQGHPADLNGDNVVDAADLAALLGNWGPCNY